MFNGFCPETIDFLWGIRMNNNREWFTEHKQDYVKYLYDPMKELGKDLFTPLMDKPGNLLKVSRIYRDARLHHPLPYKESLWICIRQDVEWWAENPCLYFEIRPEGVSYGFSLWRPKVSMMEDFRQRISARPREFLDLIGATEEVTPGISGPDRSNGRSDGPAGNGGTVQAAQRDRGCPSGPVFCMERRYFLRPR